MTFSELPKLRLESVSGEADHVTLHGQVDRLDGLREDIWLRLGVGRYIGAQLKVSESRPGVVVLKLFEDFRDVPLVVGREYTIFNSCRQAPLVEAIANTSPVWRRFEFGPTDARYFRQGSAVGWQPLELELPHGAIELGVRPGAWDHEHCNLCGGYIDVDNPTGYEFDDGFTRLFLCSTCHDRYVALHDVSFAVDA